MKKITQKEMLKRMEKILAYQQKYRDEHKIKISDYNSSYYQTKTKEKRAIAKAQRLGAK